MASLGLLTSVVLVLAAMAGVSWACNEAVCASLVSKCMLLKSCECNMMDKTNCTCCKDCHKCLAKLYTECCSCVGMCPNQNPKNNFDKLSTVEELTDPIPGLFSVLTEEPDEHLRWMTYTYPAHLDLLYFKPRGADLELSANEGSLEGHHVRHGNHHITRLETSTEYQNCTVAYMSQCMSLNKCRTSCQSMGAARYRWFHNYGCCECIGSTCLHWGKGEALCLHCPSKEDEVEEEEGLHYTANHHHKKHNRHRAQEVEDQDDQDDEYFDGEDDDVEDEEEVRFVDINIDSLDVEDSNVGGFNMEAVDLT